MAETPCIVRERSGEIVSVGGRIAQVGHHRPVLGKERASIATRKNVDADEAAKSLFLHAFQNSGMVGPAMRAANTKLKGRRNISLEQVHRWRQEDVVFNERLNWFEDQMKLDLEELALKIAFGQESDPENGVKYRAPDATMVRYLLPKLYSEKYGDQKASPSGGGGDPFLPELTRREIIDVPAKEDPHG